MRTRPQTIKSLSNDMQDNMSKIGERVDKTDARLDSVDEKVSSLKSSVDTGFSEIMEAMEGFKSLAKNNIHNTTKGTCSEDIYEHDDENGIVFEKNDDPMADVEVVRHGLTSTDSAEFKAKADQMRFDDEEIEIMVMPSQSTYPDHTFTIGVNGRLRLIMRGQKQWIPRKYVEVLLRAKVSTYGNFESRNQYNGELEVNNPETKSHRYPLQVITDKNPKGAAWLMRVTNDTRA
jgi:hypothetical protein